MKKKVKKVKKHKKRIVTKRKIMKRRKPRRTKPKKLSKGKKVSQKVKAVRKKPKKIIKKKAKPKKIIRKRPIKKKKIVKKIKVKKRVKKLKPKRKLIKKKKVVRRKSKPRKKIVRKKKVVKKSRPKKGRKFSIRRRRKSGPAKPKVYIGKGILDQLFESQAKVKLLRFFFRNTDQMFQSKEIFKKLRTNIASLRQQLKKLEKINLIKQKKAWLSFPKKRGGVRKEKKTVYCLNPHFDFFNELENLVLKSKIASKEDLLENAKKIGNIKLLLLSGVFTDDDTARADLLIVGDKINSRKLNTFLKDLEAEVGKELDCAVMTTKEFNYRYDMYDRFVRDLLNSKNEILIRKLELW